jgi:hypothetical protein
MHHSLKPAQLVVCATPLGSSPLDVQLKDLDLFAKEVMPAFRSASVAAAAEYGRQRQFHGKLRRVDTCLAAPVSFRRTSAE